MTPDDIRKLLANGWDDDTEDFYPGDLVHVVSPNTCLQGAIGTITTTNQMSAALGGLTVIVFLPKSGVILTVPMTFMPDELELIASAEVAL